MKHLFFSAFILSIFISSCSNSKKDVKDIIINGHIKGLPKNKVYLADAYTWDQFTDSASCLNDKFTFRIKPGKDFEPHMVSIAYIDISGKIRTLDIRNHILSVNGVEYSMNSFILEKGVTNIEGIVNVRQSFIMGTNIPLNIDSININSGKETDAMFETQIMNFGFMDNNNNRKEKLKLFEAVIKKYPGSYFLLKEIFKNKSLYKKSDLSEVISCFNNTVLLSNCGTALKVYQRNKSEDAKKYENFLLEDAIRSKSEFFDSTHKTNMLILWASWCAPCRNEIPILKKLNLLYKNKDFSMTSISIDKSKQEWLVALKTENMNWKQLHVNEEQLSDFQKTLDFESIPLVLFLDDKGNEINRFAGYSPNNMLEYKKIIVSRL